MEDLEGNEEGNKMMAGEEWPESQQEGASCGLDRMVSREWSWVDI